jgi:uncharacterized membrane protein
MRVIPAPIRSKARRAPIGREARVMKPLFRKLTTATAAGAGLYVAQYMYRKSRRAQNGELDEPSVVERPAARSLFGIPTAAFGLAYYGLQIAALPFSDSRAVRRGVLAASALALAQTVYLMYSLLLVTRMPCAYCWTGHAVNGLLFALALDANR